MSKVVPFHNQRSGGPVADGTQPPHDGGMEARVAKLEVAVEYIQRDVAEIKRDLKTTNDALVQFGRETNVEFRGIREEFRAVRSEMRADFRLLFGAIITVALGLAGLMGKGFGWF